MKQRQPKLDRRQALKAMGLGVSAATLGSGMAQAKPAEPGDPLTAKSSGYRESPHVLTYYATLRD